MITVKQAAGLLGFSTMRVHHLLKQRRIRGARQLGRFWFLPDHPVVQPPKKPQGRPPKRRLIPRHPKLELEHRVPAGIVGGHHL
jgi:hypothetical protein